MRSTIKAHPTNPVLSMFSNGPYPPIPARGQVGIESLRPNETAPYDSGNDAPALPPMDEGPPKDVYYGTAYQKNGALAAFFFCSLSFALWILMLAAHLTMTCACGLGGNWLVSLVPIILGPLVGTPVIMLILYLVAKLTRHTTDDWFFSTLGGGIWFFIVILSCGLPYAQTCGQFKAAENILVPAMEKTIHCWRNPNDQFSASNVNFITLQESAWVVDYSKTWKQKIFTLHGTEEDEDASSRYNFCIAPITYRGTAPGCTYNFYASCYRQTSKIGISACTAEDAIGCGWNFPANTVTMRSNNANEAFYNNAESAEYDQIMKALSYTSTPVGKQGPIVVDYANDGPVGVEAHRAAARASIDLQATIFYVLFAVSMAVHSFALYCKLS